MAAWREVDCYAHTSATRQDSGCPDQSFCEVKIPHIDSIEPLHMQNQSASNNDFTDHVSGPASLFFSSFLSRAEASDDFVVEVDFGVSRPPVVVLLAWYTIFWLCIAWGIGEVNIDTVLGDLGLISGIHCRECSNACSTSLRCPRNAILSIF